MFWEARVPQRCRASGALDLRLRRSEPDWRCVPHWRLCRTGQRYVPRIQFSKNLCGFDGLNYALFSQSGKPPCPPCPPCPTKVKFRRLFSGGRMNEM